MADADYGSDYSRSRSGSERGDDGRPVRAVQLDGLVLLKIIKHCKESAPTVVCGELLGLDVDGVLEVTASFPLPEDAGDPRSADALEYERAMLGCLDAVNVDCNPVGWYRSAFLGSFLTKQTLETMHSFQRKNPAAVLVAYDPFRTKAGKLAVKAYRLSDPFLELCEANKFGHSDFARNGVASADIVEEVPIKVHNAHLAHGFLYELREQKASEAVESERLVLAGHESLERNLELISDRIDGYSSEQGSFQFYQRSVARQETALRAYIAKCDAEDEKMRASGRNPRPRPDPTRLPQFKPVQQPSRLNSMILTRLMDAHCTEINDVAAENLQKLYVAESLRGDSGLADAE